MADWILDIGPLRLVRSEAREVRRKADRVVRIADSRLTLPLVGAEIIDAPLHSDWSYRPELWRLPVRPNGLAAVANDTKIGSEAAVFHNCGLSEMTIRQVRSTREEDLAPFGLRLDVFRFSGSFLSLVIQLPPDSVNGLKRRHLIRLSALIACEQPLEIFARLNIRHGPNTEQLVREFPFGDRLVEIDFDLAYSNLNEKRVENAWLDLIFESPEMNMIDIRDIALSRRPRAEV